MAEFRPWPKIARLNRDIIITEKIDGTNAAVGVTDDGEVYAQSRTRIITPENDNFGFAAWVEENKAQLSAELGVGLHFGEWYGKGIQRGYGLRTRRFALFNVRRFMLHVGHPVALCQTVPVLYEGPFSETAIKESLDLLRETGSQVSPFMDPEGIVVFHTAANIMFKVTLEGDEVPKGVKSSIGGTE